MFILKKLGCRLFQAVFRAALPFLPYRDPVILSDCDALGSVLQKEGLDRVLVVTDRGIVEHGLTRPLEESLKKAGIGFCIYDQTRANPTVQNVEDARALYLKQGCRGLVAIGGGSAMYCAIAVGARMAYPKKSLAQLGGILRVRRPLPLLVAVPTTAGTGSETTLAAVITDEKSHHKYALMSFPLIPRYALLDPALCRSLPPHLTATTGMDALTHAVEAYIGRSTTKKTRRMALEATALVFENLKRAYDEGVDLEAREKMLKAAYLAGGAFSRSYVGYVHAVAHSLGGQYGTPHGLANAVTLPYFLEAYGQTVHKKLYRLGIAAGVCTEKDSPKDGAEKFISAVKALNASMGIPERLSGIRKEDIPIMAKHAEREANPLYPVPILMTENELAVFYEQIADWSNEL